MSFFAKCLLVATSLSPVLGAAAIRQFTQGIPWTCWIWWLIFGVMLIVLCKGLLLYAERNVQTCILHTVEFERKDQEVLTFLFIYLLPFIRSDGLAFFQDWITSVYVLAIIIACIVYSGAYHFNPVMQLVWRYRFFSVRDEFGVPNLLISKKDLRRPRNKIKAVMLARNVYLQIGEPDV